jgi:hypothetical protein
MANRDKEEKSVGKLPYALLAAKPPNSMATLMIFFSVFCYDYREYKIMLLHFDVTTAKLNQVSRYYQHIVRMSLSRLQYGILRIRIKEEGQSKGNTGPLSKWIYKSFFIMLRNIGKGNTIVNQEGF